MLISIKYLNINKNPANKEIIIETDSIANKYVLRKVDATASKLEKIVALPKNGNLIVLFPVSYTHLTLPTKA